MENLELNCTMPLKLQRVLSASSPFGDTANRVTYQGQKLTIDYRKTRFGDTKVFFENRISGVIPKKKINVSQNRIYGSGDFVNGNLTHLIGEMVICGAIVEPLKIKNDVLVDSRLKGFTIRAADGGVTGTNRSPSPSGASEDDKIADALFQLSGGGQQPAQITSRERTPADNDADERTAQMIFDAATRGQSDLDPDHADPRRPERLERTSPFVGAGYQNKGKNNNFDDDVLVEELFQAGGGA